MFKGLKTKLECEEKGQNVNKRDKGRAKDANYIRRNTNQSTSPFNGSKEKPEDNPIKQQQTEVSVNLNQLTIQEDGLRHDDEEDDDDYDYEKNRDILLNQNSNTIHNIYTTSHNNNNSRQSQLLQTDAEQCTTEDLRRQINRLNEQLNVVTKERDIGNGQNSQLYRIIEKLRRNLESEKEINSSLKTKLAQIEAESNERNNRSDGSIAMKPFNLDPLGATIDKHSKRANLDCNVDVMRNELIELQAQISKKNRLLKINQQNLNDIKKALQKELLDHSKTQEELTKVKSLLKERSENHDGKFESSSENHSNHHHYYQSEIGDTNRDRNFNQNLSDKNQEYSSRTGVGTGGGGGEDTISLNATSNTATQLDGISYLSRSSASVDDFESNDLQQTSNNNREVSHEYLRNVLFRYMTSTDTETTRHLIKAISVLVNFTPEQSAAIKSAMNARASWLRIK